MRAGSSLFIAGQENDDPEKFEGHCDRSYGSSVVSKRAAMLFPSSIATYSDRKNCFHQHSTINTCIQLIANDKEICLTDPNFESIIKLIESYIDSKCRNMDDSRLRYTVIKDHIPISSYDHVKSIVESGRITAKNMVQSS